MRRRIGIWSCVALALLAFLLFAWPTLYLYQTWRGQLVRINRVTQNVAVLTESGWHPIEAAHRGPD